MTEQNELLDATEKLLEILATIDDLTEGEWQVIEDTRQIVERYSPKPEILEGWVNLYGPEDKYTGHVWPTKEAAKTHSSGMARQVHIREVVPVEWEPWNVETVRNHRNFQESVDAHNAEMEKVTK